MSPLLRDELRVVLYPGEVRLTRIARTLTWRGMQRRAVTRRRLDCKAVTRDEQPWTAPLDRLEEVLAEIAEGKVFATVILSNQFVRYTVLPPTDALNGPEEEQAYALHCFRQNYGFASNTWELRMSARQSGMPTLASAVDKGLLDALRALFSNAQVPLKSVQPHLMTVYNRCRTMLGDREAWLVVHEPDSLCIALVRGASWMAVRTVKVDGNWIDALPMLMTRETYLIEPECEVETVCLWAPDLGSETPPSCAPADVRNLLASMPQGFISDYVPAASLVVSP